MKMFEKVRRHGFTVPMFFVDSTGSTNVLAKDMMKLGSNPPFVVLAKSQYASYGRIKRKWVGDLVGNIYVSYAMGMRGEAGRHPKLVVGYVASKICERMRERFSLDAYVKVPNDIFVCGKKVGGLLMETVICKNHIRRAVLGVGINVLVSPEVVCPEYQAACMQDFAGWKLDFGEVSVAIIEKIVSSIVELECGNFVSTGAKDFCAVDVAGSEFVL
ncbi:MAG: biotin--[acetyl-CoA-carboxylase] ligase [Puniceicoccales bacterium]|jgi:BirA family biotin operon repressor/biotin-[acetyl-CoA-carboxylase] ligase|nr:biotin--[acetyl-CoA-carboxylase] ligase [Puniceicoccales bacterium]